MKTLKTLLFLLIVIAISGLLLTNCHSGTKGIPAKRVILIGIDGMSISGFEIAKTPNLDSFVRNGALSLKTRAVMPTVSAPNWGSHLLGAGPEQHGITANGWTVDNNTVEATVKDEDGYFPSVFKLIREQMLSAKTCMYYDWDGLGDLINHKYIDEVVLTKNFDETFEKATPWIIENKPEFSFIYIGHPDEEGHAHQWGSSEYIKAIEDVDFAIGKFVDKLKEAGLYERTHFIVVTDHGGVGNGHGGLSMKEIEIPWIISGPGIIKDKMIEQPNDVYNTAATIAYLFEIEQPDEWTGKPVLGAFESKTDYSAINTNSYVPQPFCSIESGLYTEPQLVELRVSDPSCIIRFSTQGKIPTEKSYKYKSPIFLQRSKRLMTAAFKDGNRSRITEIVFTKVIEIKNIELKFEADSKYAAHGPNTLADLIIASSDLKDGNWLGFHGDNLDATIDLGKIKDIKKVTLSCLNNNASWIFLPERIKILASVKGDRYSEIGSLSNENIMHKQIKGSNKLQIKTTPSKARFIRVIAQNIQTCPAGHPGEGEKAWLFADEIIIE